MGSRPKTRFTVELDGSLKQLFAIEEMSSGDLMIPIKHEERDVTRDLEEIREQRVSVHYSPNSTGTTIKRHTILKDGRWITAATLIKESKVELLGHLWTKAGPHMGPRYDVKPKRNDKIIDIGRFRRDHNCTLIYTVLVGEPGKSWPRLSNFTVHEATFRRFSIAVYSIYLNVPGADDSALLILASSPQQINGIAEGEPFGDGMPNMPWEGFDQRILDLSMLTGNELIENIANVADEETATFLRKWQTWYYPSGIDLAIGETHRLGGGYGSYRSQK